MWKKYRKKGTTEMRPVTKDDAWVYFRLRETDRPPFSVSSDDFSNGSPKVGDMIARNPVNHKDQWLVAEQYFKDNYELAE